jgi:lactoylglutathione lyase
MTAVRHTGIAVADLDHVLGFWCGALGFQVERRMEEYGPDLDAVLGLDRVRVTTVKLTAPDGGRVELLQFQSHPDGPEWTGTPYSTGLTHVALTVEDIEAVCTRIDDYGYQSGPLCESSDGRVKMTYCRGPEGVLLELVEETDP